MRKKKTQFEVNLESIPLELLEGGTVIAVDPSSGSKNSQPGFAIAVNGYLQNSGSLDLKLHLPNGDKVPLHRRLYLLQQELREICQSPDVVLIEMLPPFMSGRGGDFRTSSTIALHQSAGCIMATWPTLHLLPVPITTHQSLMRRLTAGQYVKSDENDAVSLLITAFRAKGIPLKNEKDGVEKCLRE